MGGYSYENYQSRSSSLAAKGFIKLQTLSGKTWASNRRQEGAPAELFDAEKQQGPLKKGKYEDVTPLGKQVVAEAEAVLA